MSTLKSTVFGGQVGGTVPVLQAVDSFTGTNGDRIAAHTSDAGYPQASLAWTNVLSETGESIQSDLLNLAPGSMTVGSIGFYTLDMSGLTAPPTRIEVDITLSVQTKTDYTGIAFRVVDADNFLYADFRQTTKEMNIWTVVGGIGNLASIANVIPALGSSTSISGIPTKLILRDDGNVVTFDFLDTGLTDALLSVSTSIHAGAKGVGLYYANVSASNVDADNFKVWGPG